VDVSLVIKQRLELFGLDQRELARAAHVTESYISQLLTRRKMPPAPNRTDIYEKMDKFLKLPRGELARLADCQRKTELKRELGDQPAPLFQEVRALVLGKCKAERESHVRAIFEQQPFGELERLVTQTLLDVVKGVATAELENDYWVRMVAELGGRSYEEMRVIVLEFLDTDIFRLSPNHCASFLDPLIDSWDIDLSGFGMQIVLNRRLAPRHSKRFEFVEMEPDQPFGGEPGLNAFLKDASLSGTVTQEEIEFLKRLRFNGKRPTPLYYYRELQNLRDPLHYRTEAGHPALVASKTLVKPM
jgi:transcriptional regulator with XRE-family HTH domain